MSRNSKMVDYAFVRADQLRTLSPEFPPIPDSLSTESHSPSREPTPNVRGFTSRRVDPGSSPG